MVSRRSKPSVRAPDKLLTDNQSGGLIMAKCIVTHSKTPSQGAPKITHKFPDPSWYMTNLRSREDVDRQQFEQAFASGWYYYLEKQQTG